MRKLKIILFLAIFHIADDIAAAASEVKSESIEHDLHDGYFVSNRFEAGQPTSFVAVQTQAAFDAVFGVAFVMRDKAHRLPPNAFKKKMVVSAIHRGNAMVAYKMNDVLVKPDGTLVISYTTKSEASGTAEFACPLIVSLDKGDFVAVTFIENGVQVKRLNL